jgi:hypothetical protein
MALGLKAGMRRFSGADTLDDLDTSYLSYPSCLSYL